MLCIDRTTRWVSEQYTVRHYSPELTANAREAESGEPFVCHRTVGSGIRICIQACVASKPLHSTLCCEPCQEERYSGDCAAGVRSQTLKLSLHPCRPDSQVDFSAGGDFHTQLPLFGVTRINSEHSLTNQYEGCGVGEPGFKCLLCHLPATLTWT